MNKAEAKLEHKSLGVDMDIMLRDMSKITNRQKDLQAIIDAPDVYEPDIDIKEGWLCRADGEVNRSSSSELFFDDWLKQGSIWPTERLAKIASLRIKITNYLGHIQYELCPDFVPDFEDNGYVKYSVLIDYRRNEISFSERSQYDEPSGVFFHTKDQAIEAGNRVKHLVDELNELIGGK